VPPAPIGEPACLDSGEEIMRLLHRHLVTIGCAIVVHAAAGVAGAQVHAPQGSQSPAADPPRVTMTPFLALGDDLAPGGGVAFTFGWTRTLSVEAEASLGTDAARTSVSLLYALPKWGPASIYVAGGGGFQRDEFETIPSARHPFFVTTKKSEFAVNIGAGVSFPISSRWAYRADFRWYNPDNEWPESWRAYSGLTFGIKH
jgi:opacity protein-like surface antigen